MSLRITIETGITILASVLAPFVLARALKLTPRWHGLWIPTLAVGIASILALQQGERVGAGFGVRLATTIWFAWIALLAFRMLRLAREEVIPLAEPAPSS